MVSYGKRISGQLIGRQFSGNILLTKKGQGFEGGVVAARNSVEGVVQQCLSDKFASNMTVRYGDGMYYLPTVEEVRLILQASQAERRMWTEQKFDCDDFAYVLKGEMSIHAYNTEHIRFALCVGIVWGYFDWISGYHAVNWFIASDGVLRFIEPQNDMIYELSRCTGGISLMIV